MTREWFSPWAAVQGIRRDEGGGEMAIRQPHTGNIPVPQMMWQGCDSMMVVDDQRRMLAMNPAMERLVGRHAPEVVGAGCGALLSCRNAQGCPLFQSSSGCPGLRSLEERRSIQNTEYVIRKADGKRPPDCRKCCQHTVS